ncbi:MAG: hypothetical protein EOO81_07710 [Oxalobacteraceae bacterium]|nr:MAG: hypothetical protein EOO81_07710 [Oxalobacteraceae bacterium]
MHTPQDQQSTESTRPAGGIDPAALAAATLAAAFSSLGQPGDYTLISSILGSTILILLLAYDVDQKRTLYQHAAFSCCVALTSILALGYFVQEAGRAYYLDPGWQTTQGDVLSLWITASLLCFVCKEHSKTEKSFFSRASGFLRSKETEAVCLNALGRYYLKICSKFKK